MNIPESHKHLIEWLHGPDPLKRRAAEDRIRMGFGPAGAIPASPLVSPASPLAFPATIPGGEGRARVLARIAACPDRGKSLPISEQPECGCAELYECRAGVGGGKVTTRDCWECVVKSDIKI
jgi:hypothetical protein